MHMDFPTLGRRLRATASTAATWCVAWGLAGLAVPFLTPGERYPPSARAVLWSSVEFAALGAFSGVVFAVMLIAARRRHRRGEPLSPKRFAIWGGVAALTLP